MYKGQLSPGVLAVIILLGLLTVSVLGYVMYLSVKAPAVKKEYKGEFDEFYSPEEVAGTDLTITDWTVNETGVVPDANVKFSYDLNGTDGQVHYAAFGVKINGGDMEDIDIKAELASGITTSEIRFHRAYILEDEKGVIMDPSDAKWTLTVDPDGDKVEGTIGPVPEGKYVVVFELKSISTSGIAQNADIFTVKMDATTEGDNDYLEATIDNYS